MTINKFIENIEAIYGKYRSGMREVIEERLSRVPEKGLNAIYNAVIENHDKPSPPSYKKIRDYAGVKGVSLATEKPYYFVSICESCGAEFNIDDYACPVCGKQRLFGLVKKKYKGGRVNV